MTLAAVIPIRYESEAGLASRLVAGRPWIATVVERLKRARSTAGVVVICRPEWRDRLASDLGSDEVVIASLRDPRAVAANLWQQRSGVFASCSGVALCPVEQLFVDPESIDAMAGLDVPSGVAQIMPVLACEPVLALTGGVFVQVLTPTGLAAAAAGGDLASLPAARWPAWPAAPELRLDTG